MQSATKLTVYTLFFLPIQTFQQSGPLIKTLQFSMSLLRIDEFFSADRGFYYSHASTPMCDKKVDFYGASLEGFDTRIAIYTSWVAYVAVAPAIYTISKIAVPAGNEEAKEIFDQWKKKSEKEKDRFLFTFLSQLRTDMWCCNVQWLQLKIAFPDFRKFGAFFSPDNYFVQFFSLVSFVLDKFIDFDKDLDGLVALNSNDDLCGKEDDAIINDDTLQTEDKFIPSPGNLKRRHSTIETKMKRLTIAPLTALLLNEDSQGLDDYKRQYNQAVKPLPSYFELCGLVHLDLMILLDVKGPFSWSVYDVFLWWLLAISCYVIPIGHLASREVGRKIWRRVAEKWYIFFLVCCGIWTERCMRCYLLNPSDQWSKHPNICKKMSLQTLEWIDDDDDDDDDNADDDDDDDDDNKADDDDDDEEDDKQHGKGNDIHHTNRGLLDFVLKTRLYGHLLAKSHMGEKDSTQQQSHDQQQVQNIC